MTNLQLMGEKARIAARQLAVVSREKDDALSNMADALIENTDLILSANQLDIDKARENGMSESLVDRLSLTPDRIKGMAKGITDIISWNDPVGKILDGRTLPNGLKTQRVTVPMGVIGIIYESRPNVTSDAAALCLKAGSSVILRGGKEAFNSNRAITEILCTAVELAGISRDSIQLVDDITRASATEMMGMVGYLDLLIPRGGPGLIKSVVENSKVPVIETGVGNCHAYVDSAADLSMAEEIIHNAKVSRPSVCNSLEKVLVHRDVAKEFLPIIKEKLEKSKVEIRGCEKTREIISCKEACDDDWDTEYLDYIIGIKVVQDIDEAMEHIAKHSSHHSEVIITENQRAADIFTMGVDSACVYVNASTRFTDGGELGLGAEIGISTQKLHARGPMGLDQIVSYKYIIKGNGQIR